VSKLKNVKKIIIGLFIFLLFIPFFSHNAIGATTIGVTTFPADVGKTYTWKATYPTHFKGAKLTFKSESIEQGVHNSKDALIVHCTMRIYDPTLGWGTQMDNELYLAANNTQNYLFFDDYYYAVLIPTPINLTLVAEVLEITKYADSYSIVNNTIILEGEYGYSYEYTFNTKGFLTKYLQKEDGIQGFTFVLDTGGGGAAIPLGNYFLIFMVISVIALVYLKKQKIK